MLSFAVFGDVGGEGPGREWTLRRACLFGPDEAPTQADLRFDPALGRIVCEKPTPDAAALSLQFRIDAPPPESPEAPGATKPLGDLVIRTCLLPERPEPYLLSLELARHRIMLFLNKLEEWGLFDLAADDPVMRQFERARVAFTGALVAQRQPGGAGARGTGDRGGGETGFTREADRMARQALSLAVDASEGLAQRQAERQIKDRLSGEAYARAAAAAAKAAEGPTALPPSPGNGGAMVKLTDVTGVVLSQPPLVGCAVNPSLFAEPLQRQVASSCDFLVLPMRWLDMEPEEGRYSFVKTDRWIEWAVRAAKLPVVGGPVIDFRPSSVPEWLYIWEHDYETLRELVYEHVKQVVTRYRRTISRWTIASGLHVNKNFQMSFEQVMDLTRICVLLVKKLQPTAKVQLEIDQPWGEYYARNRRSIPPLLYAEMVGQAGIGVDAFALRLQMGQPQPGKAARDLMMISELLDRYAALDKPLALSAVGVPSEPLEPAAPGTEGEEESPDEPSGFWRAPWSPAAQSDWMTRVFSIALAKPYVQSVCWQELCDPAAPAVSASGPGGGSGAGAGEMPFGGVLAASAQGKPAARRLAEIREAVRAGRGPLGLADGNATT
jgi:hypothetical protein